MYISIHLNQNLHYTPHGGARTLSAPKNDFCGFGTFKNVNIFTKIDISTRAVIKFVFLMPKNDHLVHEAYSTLFNFEKVRGSSGVETPIGMIKKPRIWFSTTLNRLVITANPCDDALVL